MPRLEERDDTYFTTVRGLCRGCRRVTPARVFFRDGRVWQQVLCPTCGGEPVLIAGDRNWYLEHVLRPGADRSPLPGAHPPRNGCPHDCGPCTWHASPCQLPVFSITNACDLRCPICFTYNRPDRIWHMSLEEMKTTVDGILADAGPVDLVNITGGEPTLHPHLLDLLACCRRPGIGRITMNSNGLRLAEDADLCRRLADLGVCVILSFNTFDPAVSVRMHGRDVVAAKRKALDNLTRAGARVTLLQVLARGMNEDAIPGLLDLLRGDESVLSLTIQTMTYTGQGGGAWSPRNPIPVDEAARMVAERSGGSLRFEDFLPRPSAHPLCYLTCYALKAGETLHPFARFADRETIQRWMRDSYLIRLEGEERVFRGLIDDLYARGETEALSVFRQLVERLYPPDRAVDAFERQRLGEACVRTVYLHAHMDEETFDCSRAMRCPDLVPAAPGRLIPACTYNLIYRMQDKRFYDESARMAVPGTRPVNV